MERNRNNVRCGLTFVPGVESYIEKKGAEYADSVAKSLARQVKRRIIIEEGGRGRGLHERAYKTMVERYCIS